MKFTELNHHRLIKLEGDIAVIADFLNNLTTNNFKGSSFDQPIFSFILDSKGKIIAQFIAFKMAEKMPKKTREEKTDVVCLQTPSPQVLGMYLAKNKLGLAITIKQGAEKIYSWGWGDVSMEMPLDENLIYITDPRCGNIGGKNNHFHIHYIIGNDDYFQDYIATQSSKFSIAGIEDFHNYRIQQGVIDNEYENAALMPANLFSNYKYGVDFNKGCYPGQEVVARIHFKGQVKKQVFPFSHNTQPDNFKIGDDILAEGKNVGTIISTGKNHGLALILIGHVEDTLITANGIVIKCFVPQWQARQDEA